MWKVIEAHPNYSVSMDGQVKNNSTGRIKKIRVKNGYCFVGLSKSHRIKKWVSLHRLVAIAYIDNPENKPEVNHKDGDKLNCNKSNLEWSTKLENMQHAVKNGLFRPKLITAKPILQYDLSGNFICEWQSARFAGRELGISNSAICGAAKGRENRSQSGGYIWKFKDQVTPILSQ